jgi:hypothetical protein
MYVIRRNITHDYLKIGSTVDGLIWTRKLEDARIFRTYSKAEKVAGSDTDNEIGYVGHIKEFLQEPE